MMNDQVEIMPLTFKDLKAATKLVNSVFNDEETKPSRELKASISEKSFISYRKKVDDDVTYLKYYVAVQNNNVIGIVGIYFLKKDCEDTAWLGWYCVSQKARGLGVGGGLLQFAINEVKRTGKSYLSLYTSTDINEQEAQLVYEKYGFYITGVEHEEGYDILYRRKIL